MPKKTGTENGDRSIFSRSSRRWPARTAALDAAADDLLHLIHEALVAGELASLQRLTHQRQLLLRYALLHEARIACTLVDFVVRQVQVRRVQINPRTGTDLFSHYWREGGRPGRRRSMRRRMICSTSSTNRWFPVSWPRWRASHISVS